MAIKANSQPTPALNPACSQHSIAGRHHCEVRADLKWVLWRDLRVTAVSLHQRYTALPRSFAYKDVRKADVLTLVPDLFLPHLRELKYTAIEVSPSVAEAAVQKQTFGIRVRNYVRNAFRNSALLRLFSLLCGQFSKSPKILQDRA